MSELERVRDVLEAASLNKQDGYTVGEAINALNTHITQDKEREAQGDEMEAEIDRLQSNIIAAKIEWRDQRNDMAKVNTSLSLQVESLQSQLAELTQQRDAIADQLAENARLAIAEHRELTELREAVRAVVENPSQAAFERILALIPTTPVREGA